VLRESPWIGAPGAEKILLACGASGELALESNGLRALVRLGYGTESAAYAKTYRSVSEAIAGEVEGSARWAWRAHGLLPTHGMEVCRRSQRGVGSDRWRGRARLRGAEGEVESGLREGGSPL
jgi:hypothetical protein